MKGLFNKGFVILVAILLVTLCVGTTFGLYTKSATSKDVAIVPFVPSNMYLHSHWTSWSNDDEYKLTYNNGEYVSQSVSICAGLGFKIYDTDLAAFVTTFEDYGTSGFTKPGEDSYFQCTSGGVYDIIYNVDSGIRVEKDRNLYSFCCPAGDVGDNDVYAYMWGDGDGFYKCTYVGTKDSCKYYTCELTGKTGCLLLTVGQGQVANWDNKIRQTSNLDFDATGLNDTTGKW